MSVRVRSVRLESVGGMILDLLSEPLERVSKGSGAS